MKSDEQYYLVVMITNTSDSKIDPREPDFNSFVKMTDDELDEWLNGQTTEPVALYGDFETALEWVEKLTEKIKGTKDEGTVYFDILGMDLDPETPQLMTDLIHEEEILRSTIEDILIRLMKQGLVDQLIGEDGKFYYEITDSGREKMKDLPPHLRAYLDKPEDLDLDDDMSF